MFISFKLVANSEPMDEDEADEAFLLADLVASRPSGCFLLEVPTKEEFRSTDAETSTKGSARPSNGICHEPLI
jgi:hypothetical protein